MAEQRAAAVISADAIDRLRQARPHARIFLEPFVGLLLARPVLVTSLMAASETLPAPRPEPARLGLGACLEPRDVFPCGAEALRQTFEALQPVLTHAFRAIRTDLMVIGQAVAADVHLLPQAASDMLCDRRPALRRTAGSLGVAANVFGFWCVQMLTPLAMARGLQLAGSVDDSLWNRGYCPVCGSWPGYGRVTGEGTRMTCSFCSTSWMFTRRECPYCEAPTGLVPMFAMPGFESERVSVCGQCNHYLGEFEADSLSDSPPEAAALVLAPLELLARQHGHVAASMDWRQMVWSS